MLWTAALLACISKIQRHTLLTEASGLTDGLSCSPQSAAPLEKGREFYDVVDSGSQKRSYLVTLPRGYHANKRHPLLLVFHGVSSTAAITAGYTEFSKIAENWIVVYPEGMGDASDDWQPPSKWGLVSWQSWNGSGTVGSPGPAGPTCAPGAKKVPGTPCYKSCGKCADHCWWTTCTDDVQFVARLLDRLEASFCVDTSRVVASGFSNGAIFLYELAADPALAARFAAIAPVAGLPNVGFNRPPASQQLRLFGLWGRKDPGVPGFWSPGEDIFGEAPADGINVAASGWYFVSAPVVARSWAEALGTEFSGRNFTTPFDNELGLSCVSSSAQDATPTLPDVVVCAWDGVHQWAGAGNGLHAEHPKHLPLASRLLVTSLLDRLPRGSSAQVSWAAQDSPSVHSIESMMKHGSPALATMMLVALVIVVRKFFLPCRRPLTHLGYVTCPN